jgi:Mrp family chromosome partitioning ATPase
MPKFIIFLLCLLPSFTLPGVIIPNSATLRNVFVRNQNVLNPGLLRLFGGSIEKEDVPENAPAGCPGTASAEAGKQDSCQGCPNQSACASGEGGGPDPDKLAAKIRMEGVRYKLLVLSGKGGVGKSTLATQLAMALSSNGDLTGLLDIDICGPSIPRMVGVEGEEVRQVF